MCKYMYMYMFITCMKCLYTMSHVSVHILPTLMACAFSFVPSSLGLPDMSDVDFVGYWAACKQAIYRACKRLRNKRN